MSFAIYSYSLHQSLLRKKVRCHLKLGHTHQLLAAALGYGSLAAYKSAAPAERFGQQIVVDQTRLQSRIMELELSGISCDEFVSHLKLIATQVVHGGQDEYINALAAYVGSQMPDLAEVKTYLQGVNARIKSIDVHSSPFYGNASFHSPYYLHVIDATVQLAGQDGRRLAVDTVFFDGSVAVEFFGRRCVGDFSLSGSVNEEISEIVDYSYLCRDD